MTRRKNKQKILLISRKFPPTHGGMQKFAHDLYAHLSQTHRVVLIAWSRSNMLLPLFFVLAFINACIYILTNRPDVVFIYDAVLSPLAFLIKQLFGIKVVVIVNGLDLTYPNPLYQKLLRMFLPRVSGVICISQDTARVTITKGVDIHRCSFIPIGIDVLKRKPLTRRLATQKLANRFHLDLRNKKIILTVGRLVKRKGHRWFITHVMPKLPKEYVYFIAGTGPEEIYIRNAIVTQKLHNQVYLLGAISEVAKEHLICASNLMVLPNIRIAGDMEGFGIVALESSIRGVPVVASAIQGMKDSVVDHETGFLIAPGNVAMWCSTILAIGSQKPALSARAIKNATTRYFDWHKIVNAYMQFVSTV